MKREDLWRIVREVYRPMVQPYGIGLHTLHRAFDRSYGFRGASHVNAFRARFEAQLRPMIAAALEQQIEALERQISTTQAKESHDRRAADMCAQRRDGATIRQIAEAHGVSQARVWQILDKHDARHPSPEAVQRKRDMARFRHRQRQAERRKRMSA